MTDFYRIAREVTDEVMGPGTYAATNRGNPDPQVRKEVLMSDDAEVFARGSEEEVRARVEEYIEAERNDPNAFQVSPGAIRVASTPLLLMLMKDAAQRGYNRQLRDTTKRRLDWNGTHVVRRFGYHFHANGEVVPRHVRAQCWLKLRGQKKALEIMLDFDEEKFDRLHLADPELVDVTIGDMWNEPS